jgi:O-antigen/teichoic acid export membrane protein
MPEGFGQYALALTVASFFITFSDLGINQTLVRYVASRIDKNNSESAAYFEYLSKIKLWITLSLSGILFLISYPLAVYIFHDIKLFLPLMILSFYVLINSLISFIESLFYIKKNVKYISVKEFFSLIIKLGIVLAVGYFVSYESKLVTLFFSFVILSAIILISNLYFSRYFHPTLFKKTNVKINKREVKKFIFSLNIQNIALMILYQATIILLGIFLTKDYVGYYNAAWTLIISIPSLLSLTGIFLPIFSNIEEIQFRSLIEKTFRLFFILTLPISCGLSLLSRFFIVTIYGYDYLPASTSLSILAFLIPCMMGLELALASFSARNKQKKFTLIMVISSLVFILLNYIFIKFLSSSSGESILIGVSIANLISWLFCFVCTIYLLKKELNISVISLSVLKSISSCLIMSAFIIFSLNLFRNMNLIYGFFIILSSALVYFISLFFMKGITKQDISLIKGIYRKR